MPQSGTKALVLGGGGPVGRAWHAGLLAGFLAHGIDLGLADAIIGTSAGAVVGAQLSLGLDAARKLPVLDTSSGSPSAAAATASADSDSGPYAPTAERTAGLRQMFALCARSVTSAAPEAEWRAIGALSLAAPTPSEEEALARPSLRAFVGQAWPARFRATTVNARTGAFRVWTAADGAPLERGVSASASLPWVWPAVTMGDEGDRYIDGGMRSLVNADLASGFARVVVVSCFPLEGAADGESPLGGKVLDEIKSLRLDGSLVSVITPSEELLTLTNHGANMLDPTLVPAAYEAGKKHADSELEEIRRVWAGSE